MTHLVTRFLLLLLLLGGPPLLGLWLGGGTLQDLRGFPPPPPADVSAPLDWMYFAAVAVFLLAVVGPLVVRVLEAGSDVQRAEAVSAGAAHGGPPRGTFPAWGWLGVALTLAAWLLAWTRFEWLGPWQRHTFTPLWLGYIVVVNALTRRRTGRCMLADDPWYFLSLFPLSAVFWWSFEYLNRFVGNWYYVGIGDFGPWDYVAFSSVSFSTVLPAVLGTRDLLESFPRLSAGLERFRPIPVPAPRTVAAGGVAAGVLGMGALGLWPDVVYPLVWVGPLLTVTGLHALAGGRTVFSGLPRGDWRGLWLPALAALACGFFWEMWNSGSLAHWEYAIPHVDAFRIFAMPLLGYAGYLPFGITCVAVVDFLLEPPERSALPAERDRPGRA